MANPVFISLPEGDWIKVAENVTFGQVHKFDLPGHYIHTYRITGEPPPSDEKGVRMASPSIKISSSEPIDVYFKCVDQDGEVRVDLP